MFQEIVSSGLICKKSFGTYPSLLHAFFLQIYWCVMVYFTTFLTELHKECLITGSETCKVPQNLCFLTVHVFYL
jgi:hypothetical protein